MGFFAGQQDAVHFRVDLMDLVRMVEMPRTEDCQRGFRINQIMEEDYQAAHLYMFYEGPKERPRQIRLRVKKFPASRMPARPFSRIISEPIGGLSPPQRRIRCWRSG